MTIDRGLVSVIIPTYNDEEYLPRAIDSAKEQSYSNIEAIVVDSGDSDSVRELVSSYEFARYIYDEPRGPAAARNTGIDEANGEFIAFLDADDMWLPKKIELQIQELTLKSGDFVYCDQYVTSQADNSDTLNPETWQYREGMKLTNNEPPHVKFFHHGGEIGSRTVVGRKKCFEEERFWEELKLREDPNLWVRILSNFQPVNVSIPLAVKFRRTDSITTDAELMLESKIKSVEMLADKHPELSPYVDRRIRSAKYSYIGSLLDSGKSAEARSFIARREIKTSLPFKSFIYLVTCIPKTNRLVFRSAVILAEDGLIEFYHQAKRYLQD